MPEALNTIKTFTHNDIDFEQMVGVVMDSANNDMKELAEMVLDTYVTAQEETF